MIVVSYVRHHRLVPDQLADLITSVHRAFGHFGQPPEPEEVSLPLCRCAVPFIGTM